MNIICNHVQSSYFFIVRLFYTQLMEIPIPTTNFCYHEGIQISLPLCQY